MAPSTSDEGGRIEPDQDRPGQRRPTPDQSTPETTGPAPTSRINRRRGLRNSLLLAAGVIVIVLAAQAFNWVPSWLDPFAEETKDRTGPVLLKSMRDLSRYEAASGNFQVIVDLEKDTKFIPSGLRGRRTLFVGTGSVDAYVDFSKLPDGAISVSEDRTAVTVRLPRAQLEPTSLDPGHSYVYATQRGLTDRIGDFFSGNPSDQQQLYVLASQRIQTAAAQSGLRERADRNTKVMLENMLKALGFTKVTVQIGNSTG